MPGLTEGFQLALQLCPHVIQGKRTRASGSRAPPAACSGTGETACAAGVSGLWASLSSPGSRPATAVGGVDGHGHCWRQSLEGPGEDNAHDKPRQQQPKDDRSDDRVGGSGHRFTIGMAVRYPVLQCSGPVAELADAADLKFAEG